MIRQCWPLVLLLAASCSNGFWACGTYRPCCHATPTVVRDVTYVGSLPASDGGTPTQVKMVVGSQGNARLTFVRDGVEVLETFAARPSF